MPLQRANRASASASLAKSPTPNNVYPFALKQTRGAIECSETVPCRICGATKANEFNKKICYQFRDAFWCSTRTYDAVAPSGFIHGGEMDKGMYLYLPQPGTIEELDEDEQEARIISDKMEIALSHPDPLVSKLKVKRIAKDHNWQVKDLLSAYSSRSSTGTAMVLESVDELMKSEEADPRRKFLVPGLIPKGTVIMLTGDGGTGKTPFAIWLARIILKGKQWTPFGTPKPAPVWIIQTDSPRLDTQDNLRASNYAELQGLNLKFCHIWNFSQIPILSSMLEKLSPEERPGFVVIDSYTSSSVGSAFSEKDTEYGANIYLLKDLAQTYETTFLIIHHTNSSGRYRGTTALYNNVSEYWLIEKPGETDLKEGVRKTERFLSIQKSRAGLIATYSLEIDPSDYSWKCYGYTDQNTEDISLILLDELRSRALRGRFHDVSSLSRILRMDKGRHRELDRTCAKLFRTGYLERRVIESQNARPVYEYGIFEEIQDEMGQLKRRCLSQKIRPKRIARADTFD